MLGHKTPGLPALSAAGAPVAPMPESVDGVDRPEKEVPFYLLCFTRYVFRRIGVFLCLEKGGGTYKYDVCYKKGMEGMGMW